MDKALIKKYELYIIPGVSAVIGILIISLLVIPQALSIPKTNEEIAALRTKNEQLSAKVSILDSVKEDEYKALIETALNALPADPEVSGVFGQLLYLVQNNSLSLKDIAFAGTDASPNSTKMGEFTVKLAIAGQPDDISAFIDKLKTAPRILKITDLEVNSSGKEVALEISTNMITFFQGMPVNIPAVEEPVNLPKDLSILDQIEKNLADFPKSDEATASGDTGKSNPFQ